jgi:Tfp pilus assembly protein PilX
MTTSRNRLLRDERGMALAIALLVLLVMSLLATVLMVSIHVESKITSHGLRETNALNVAEAGIGEAQGRIACGDIALASNPRAVAQIFNVAAGSVPVLGTDSTGLATAQPAGEWLPYSTASRGPNVLTVEYKTDNARSTVYRYDATKTPAVQTLSGSPIYVITSTGVVGGDVRKVRAEVYAKRVPANVYAAMMANVAVELKGTIDVCGYNHTSSMPTGHEDDPIYHTGTGDLPGTWSSGEVDVISGAAYTDGDPVGLLENQTGPYTGPNGFYAGPWDVFDMTQAEFFSWIGSPVATPPQPPDGLVYIDGDAAYHGGDGEGLLYVTGDLTINGTFTFRGLIYVEGDLHLNGDSWILGGLIVKGTTTVKLANGNAAVLYGSDMISEAISRASGMFMRLSWRELY